jgi:hypothetical protein
MLAPRRVAWLVAGLVALVVAFPPATLAKGGDEAGITAVIEGPGLDTPILLAGESPRDAELVMRVADTAGLDSAVGEFPDPRFNADPLLDERPKGELGPRYTITYFIAGPNDRVARVTQDLYPHAKLTQVPYIVPGDTLTYTAPGQSMFGSDETRGGWYIATSHLKENLVAAGVSENPPADGGGSELPWVLIGGLAGVGIVLTLAVRRLRHGQSRTVTA